MEIQNEEQEPIVMTKLHQNVDDIFTNIEKLEKRMNKIEKFYSSPSKKPPNAVKDKSKQMTSGKRRQQDASCREAAAASRMQDLMHQLSGLLHQHIMEHKWAGPFMQPVDVVGLGLHDYHEVIEKPMDFSAIKNKMEAKDGTGYKTVREICADVRLIFKNAMKYNDEKDDVHVMAKTLLGKFEEVWLQLLPKVIKEDEIRKKENAEAKLDLQLAQEADHAKMARELSLELDAVDLHLQKLKEVVLSKCRKMSLEDKRTLMKILTKLSPDDLQKALLIVAQNNPNFEATCKEVELDMDAQSESILWKLKFFVKDVLKVQRKGSSSIRTISNNNENNPRKRKK